MVKGVTVETAAAAAVADALSTLSPSESTKTTSLGWIKALRSHRIQAVRPTRSRKQKIASNS